jgi:hypothetical protein
VTEGGRPPNDGGPGAFAFHHLFLGESDRNGTQDVAAWKQYGRNIDGLMTGPADTNVCTPYMGANRAASQTDGNQGIDNSWGANMIPLVQTFSMTPSTMENQAVGAGLFTILVDIAGLSGNPMQTSAMTPGQLFTGTPFGGTPTFTSADDWPVAPEGLVDGKTIASGSKVSFPKASTTNGTWASAPPTDMPLRLLFGFQSLEVTLKAGVVSFDHTMPNHAATGQFSGVVATEDLVAAVQEVLGSLSQSFCSGSASAAIAAQVRQSSDIMKDGTNTPGSTCDGISVGIGFDADLIGPVNTVGPMATPQSNPCPDAGSD